jgi:hypothetical protein
VSRRRALISANPVSPGFAAAISGSGVAMGNFLSLLDLSLLDLRIKSFRPDPAIAVSNLRPFLEPDDRVYGRIL